jgi:hypothetical protein
MLDALLEREPFASEARALLEANTRTAGSPNPVAKPLIYFKI